MRVHPRVKAWFNAVRTWLNDWIKSFWNSWFSQWALTTAVAFTISTQYPHWNDKVEAQRKNAEQEAQLNGEIRNRLTCEVSTAAATIRDKPQTFAFDTAVDTLLLPLDHNTPCNFASDYSQYGLITLMSKLETVADPGKSFRLRFYEQALLTYRASFPNTDNKPALAADCYMKLISMIWSPRWGRPGDAYLKNVDQYNCSNAPTYGEWVLDLYADKANSKSIADVKYDTSWPPKGGFAFGSEY